jgi:hypothetical protein
MKSQCRSQKTCARSSPGSTDHRLFPFYKLSSHFSHASDAQLHLSEKIAKQPFMKVLLGLYSTNQITITVIYIDLIK